MPSRFGGGAGLLFVQCRGDGLAFTVDVDFLPKLVDQLRIGQRPVAVGSDQAVAFDQRIEIVAVMFRIKRPREFDGAHHRSPKINAQPLEFLLEKAVIKARIVRDKQAPFEPAQSLRRHLGKRRCLGHHFVADAG